MDDTISSNAVSDSNASEAVDLDGNQASIATNINAEVLAFKACGKVNMV